MNEIRFYRASERPYGCFSNLYRVPVEFEGQVYDTAEHAYQAGKPRKPEVRQWLLAAPSPSLLAAAAHALLSWDIAPGWSRERRGRMRRVVEAKFRQHGDLADVLIGTGDARIVETATVDNEVNRRWGEVNGRGSNWLGLILMEVRQVLRAERCAEASRAVPLIFLDIDGVLNHCGAGGDARGGMFARECIEAFNGLVHMARAEVVLSSTWRKMVSSGAMTVAGFEQMLLTHRCRCRMVGITLEVDPRPGVRPWDRGAQIQEWRRGNQAGERPYVVLDDDDDGITREDHPFVQTDGRVGLTVMDGVRAIELLRQQRGDMEVDGDVHDGMADSEAGGR